mmetsp:Transcript_90957/g.257598  ORF Transcript_90957/g.257598 Transcript_90957/m.257598 type:complete len:416 (+) Transcript_90957:167-1414(+)
MCTAHDLKSLHEGRPCAALHVTPELSVPEARLPTEPLWGRVASLAQKESAEGLVDEGGVFNFAQDAVVLGGVHPHGFIAAATAAFASHYPLSVRPQHLWLMILQATAVHVGRHAEELRAKWVAHEGKKELDVRCDEFCFGAKNNWASVVDGKPDCFSKQIDRSLVDGVAQELAPAFTDTSQNEKIALQITVMDVTKSFFSFKCTTMCGFPWVVMEGSAEDWQLLRTRAEALVKQRCQASFAEKWCAALLPLLDKLGQEYAGGSGNGRPDEQFWNSMCKRGGTSGSGARTWFSGWVNILFPYIDGRDNHYMSPYRPDSGYAKEGRDGGRYGMSAPRDVQGPDCVDFPNGLAAAPVLWDYYGTEKKLKFKAGFLGAEQDRDSGVVRPVVGWFIAHDGDGEREGKGNGKGKGKLGSLV